MKALIIGIDGQDGYYLRNYLCGIGYEVFGVVRKKSAPYHTAIEESEKNYRQIFADLHDLSSLINAITEAEPDEIYNLAGQSEIPLSWRQPVLTAEVNALGVMRLLEAIRILDPKIRFFQASSSELYGDSGGVACTEETPFRPRNPYGSAKLFAHNCVENYREKYGLYACCGILFNHESPRRGIEFVTRKITTAAARIYLGLQEVLELGNLDAVRDWGSAEDYVRVMHLMLRQEKAKDYVIATGEPHTVREFVTTAFRALGVTLDWKGVDFEEVGRDGKNGRILVRVNPALYRLPKEDRILGDPQKARRELGFHPEHTFESLIGEIVRSDMALLTRSGI